MFSCNFLLLYSWHFLAIFNAIFSSPLNTRSIFKVLLFDLNLTKLDILASSISNMTTPTLKTTEHLKKNNKHTFFLSTFCLKSYFHTFSLTCKKKFITGIYTKFMCSITFVIRRWLSKKWQKIRFNLLNQYFFGTLPLATRPIESINCHVHLSVCPCVVCAIGKDLIFCFYIYLEPRTN